MGARVHAILWAKRETQARLAARLGITATTLSKKLRGTVPLTVDELVRVATILDVPVGQLLDPDTPLDPAACLTGTPRAG